MSKLLSELTPAEKLTSLVDEVAAQAGATRADLRKLTPRGRMLRKVTEGAARKLYGATGDKNYLVIARAMHNSFRTFEGVPEAKPAPSYDKKAA